MTAASARANASCVVVAKIDAALHPKLARKFRAESLPTVMLLRRGEEIRRHVGLMPRDQLQQFVRGRDEMEV